MIDTPKTMVRCQRVFKHPAAKLFEAFLSPSILRNWYGPRDTVVGEIQVEPVVGGRFDVELISERFGILWVRGFYQEIMPSVKLVYSFIFDPDIRAAGDSIVTVNFDERPEGTEVTVLQVLQKVIDPVGRTQGWTDILANLEAFLEKDI